MAVDKEKTTKSRKSFFNFDLIYLKVWMTQTISYPPGNAISKALADYSISYASGVDATRACKK